MAASVGLANRRVGAPASADSEHPLRNGVANQLSDVDRGVHDWYRFVLSFPPHLVRTYIARFGLGSSSLVLDPFCGTGTTLVECRKRGIPSLGVESHPMTSFAAQVKLDWSPDPNDLLVDAKRVAEHVLRDLDRLNVPDSPLTPRRHGSPRPELRTLPREQMDLLLENSISPRPLHKALVLRDAIRNLGDPRLTSHELLALARVLVFSASNLVFGPEVGVEAPKADAPVVGPWLDLIRRMSIDLGEVRGLTQASAQVVLADAREVGRSIPAESVAGVFTSPPYPNEKDYTRTTRLESVVLGFIEDKATLRKVKRGLVRSNTRGVYKGDDDDKWVESHSEIQRISESIEKRRLELGKTSGFERMYPRATKLYFGGMARHLANLRPALRRGARLAYVVGDQASYLQVMIRTGRLLAQLAEDLGYEVERVDLFRTRLATATKQQLREEVVVLRWPGG